MSTFTITEIKEKRISVFTGLKSEYEVLCKSFGVTPKWNNLPFHRFYSGGKNDEGYASRSISYLMTNIESIRASQEINFDQVDLSQPKEIIGYIAGCDVPEYEIMDGEPLKTTANGSFCFGKRVCAIPISIIKALGWKPIFREQEPIKIPAGKSSVLVFPDESVRWEPSTGVLITVSLCRAIVEAFDNNFKK